MKKNIVKVKSIIFNNKVIIENYFFMTVLQILNSFFYLLIYPFLIRSLGSEAYGTFIFATSIVTYFIFLINFGFDFPAVKHAAQNISNNFELEKLLSNIFTSKILLFIVSVCIIGMLYTFVPFIQANLILIIICFSQTLYHVLLPQWFFQAFEKMKIITYIQLATKFISLPVIFILVKNEDDLIAYSIIVSLTSVISAIIAFFVIRFKFNFKIKITNFYEVSIWFKEAFPFFLSNSAGVIKEQSIIIIIGSFFGMKEVAIYDLANKIISIPKTLLTSVNSAIFPALVKNYDSIKIKKIIKIEYIVSLLVVLFIIIVGKYIVLFLGSKDMLMAYPLSILLSFTIMVWLVVGAYISFVFVPKNQYYFATKNQILALTSFGVFCWLGLILKQNILVLGIAIVLSGLCEILYCKWVIYKLKML
ncbi:oligosaccharide flippase family protein [Acinetobacter johnsonii]|uniref:oligosaccharide flippase family protein n=1 Tax=Acinetobacter johnsonii TaxID=40214 RepID=UPI000F65B4CC|nr:oligosaccharide flippase family protein [Acinetobacter johnsonii]QYA55249.1 oligosaccharide flippase family protein [Acinetobacter johnsonii]